MTITAIAPRDASNYAGTSYEGRPAMTDDLTVRIEQCCHDADCLGELLLAFAKVHPDKIVTDWLRSAAARMNQSADLAERARQGVAA